jgi:hypothetical protein
MTARLFGPSSAHSTQDPGPGPTVTITTEMVKAAFPPIEEPPAGQAVDRLLKIAATSKVGVVVAASVAGESKCDLAGAGWREAIDRIAAELGVGVAAFGDFIVVGIGEPVDANKIAARFVRPESDAMVALKQLASVGGIDLVVATDAVRGRVAIDVADVPLRAVLAVLATQLGLEHVGVGGVSVLRRRGEPPTTQRASLNFRDRGFTQVIDIWAHLARRNVMVGEGLNGNLSVRVLQSVEADLLTALTAVVEADWERAERGILRVRRRLELPTPVALTAERVDAAAVLHTLGIAPLLCTVAADGEPVSIFVWRASAHDLLPAVALASSRTWSRRGDGYVIE